MKKKNKNSIPSSFFEAEDRCPTCSDYCDVEKDLDDQDYCNNCRPKRVCNNLCGENTTEDNTHYECGCGLGKIVE